MHKFLSDYTFRILITRIISLLLVFVITFSALPIDAIAADYNVDSAESMVNSWNDANSNSDSSNNFNVTNSIDMSNHGLVTSSDKTYNIQTSNNSDVSNLDIVAGGSSGSVVNIQTDVTSSNTDSALSVSGDVTVIVSKNVEMNVSNDVDPNPNFVITVTNDADVTVMGDVISNDAGVMVSTDSELTINGDFISEGQSAIMDNSELNVRGDLISEEGADSIGPYSGVFVSEESSMTVEGKIETPLLYVSGDSDVASGTVESHAVVVGYPLGQPSDGSDTSTLRVNGDITNDTKDTSLNAAQKSTTNINGNVNGTVYASDNAYVFMTGTAKKIVKSGNARVTTKAHSSAASSANEVRLDNEDILALCLNKDKPNSPMQQHLKKLSDLRSIAATELLDDLGLGDAFLISIFNHEDINLSNFAVLSSPELDNTSLYHPDSVRDLQKRYSKRTVTQREMTRTIESYDLSAHEINQYKKHLAESMADVKNVVKPDSTTEQLIHTVRDITASFYGFCDSANPSILSSEQISFLEKASKNGFTLKEAKEFLTKFRGFDIAEKDMDKAAKNLQDMFNLGDDVKKKIKAAKNVSKADKITKYAKIAFYAADFAEYWATNYEYQVTVLDTMLKEQYLTPEMFVAASQLREEYENKFLGTFVKGVEKGIKAGTSLLKGTWFAFSAAETLVDIAGFATGLSSKTDALYTAVSQCSLAPVAMDAYRNAIQRVAEGDTSPEAVNMVKMTYSIVKNSLSDLCNGMIKNGNKEQQSYYKNILNKLKALEIGEELPVNRKLQ